MATKTRRTGFVRALLGAVALVSCLASFGADRSADGGSSARATGRLEGSVTLGPKLTARRLRASLYADPRRSSTAVGHDAPAGEIGNVVVYLEHAPEGVAPTHGIVAPYRIEQDGLSFRPHVLAVVKGTTVEFPNRDMLFHNVFSLSKAASFDLGRYPKDGSKSVRFDVPGIVPVFCHIHSDMSAIVLVLDNPFFASPDATGRFEIDGIPPGDYRVVAWHERAHRISRTVHIEPGRAASLEFEIPLMDDANGG